jgi:hypothetical protein
VQKPDRILQEFAEYSGNLGVGTFCDGAFLLYCLLLGKGGVPRGALAVSKMESVGGVVCSMERGGGLKGVACLMKGWKSIIGRGWHQKLYSVISITLRYIFGYHIII